MDLIILEVFSNINDSMIINPSCAFPSSQGDAGKAGLGQQWWLLLGVQVKYLVPLAPCSNGAHKPLAPLQSVRQAALM